MKAGPFRWKSSRFLAAVAAFSGLILPGLGGGARAADKPKDAAAKGASAADSSHKLEFIDEMIREGWESASVKPSPAASDAEFLRRAYLDVLGRIPNIEEASAFLLSKEAGKRAKLVNYLLEHPDFAKNFGNQWTVLLLGRRRQEREVDRGALAAWIRRQFNENRPWNEIVNDLITAKGSNKENGAVNFTLAHLEGGAVPLTSVTTRVFLGQQIQCTQCHDHPSNDWKQADFWGINAFFKGIKKENVMTADATGAEVYNHTDLSDEPTNAYAKFEKRNAMLGVAYPKFLDGRKISQGPDVDRRVELGKLIADPKNADLAKAFVNRMWGHFLGRGIVQPVDDFGPHNPPSHPELLDELAKKFQESNYHVKDLVRWIMASEAYQLSSVSTKANEKDETLFSHLALKPMSPEQLFDSLLTATAAHKTGGGDTDKKRDAWLGQFTFAFATDEQDEGTTFSGTIPQALMMMNGELMEKATGGKPGSFLADLKDRALRQRKVRPDLFMVNNLYLAAVSRYPSTKEMAVARHLLESQPDTIYILEDVFWVLLNSSEFVLNH